MDIRMRGTITRAPKNMALAMRIITGPNIRPITLTKLTNVARASLEELLLDYEDFLRQRGLKLWAKDDPRRAELVALRCASADEVAAWIKALTGVDTDRLNLRYAPVSELVRGLGPARHAR